MTIQYKIDGVKVSRQDFLASGANTDLLASWEKAISRLSPEMDKQNVRVIIHSSNHELKVVTETGFLMRLHFSVCRDLYAPVTSKSTALTRLPRSI